MCLHLSSSQALHAAAAGLIGALAGVWGATPSLAGGRVGAATSINDFGHRRLGRQAVRRVGRRRGETARDSADRLLRPGAPAAGRRHRCRRPVAVDDHDRTLRARQQARVGAGRDLPGSHRAWDRGRAAVRDVGGHAHAGGDPILVRRAQRAHHARRSGGRGEVLPARQEPGFLRARDFRPQRAGKRRRAGAGYSGHGGRAPAGASPSSDTPLADRLPFPRTRSRRIQPLSAPPAQQLRADEELRLPPLSWSRRRMLARRRRPLDQQ